MGEHYRARRISETILRYRHERIGNSERWTVRDRETGQLLDGADYETEPMARAKCRLQAAADIERLYLPDQATAMARVANIIAEQSDPQWAARMIFEYFQGAKA